MTIDQKDVLNSILKSLSSMEPLRSADLPNINLYMDQLTTFMDSHLIHTKRYTEDKVLTKTMINNYAKNNILPSPDRKQYSSEHLLTLVFIYYFKNILSITDIQKVLDPIHQKYFASSSLNVQAIYDEVYTLEEKAMEDLKTDVSAKYAESLETFQNVNSKDREFLQQFSFICELCFDIYLKKLIVEKMIDELPDPSKRTREEKEAKRTAKQKKK